LFPEIIKAIFIGIIQGITEWLPISSTGHMILADEFIKLSASEAFKEMFLVVIQLGSILAVLFLYFDKLNPFSKNKSINQKKETYSLWLKVLVAVIPSGIVGVLFDDKIEELFFNYKTVSFTLILYGILFILIENKNKSALLKIDNFHLLTYKHAFLIGLFQILALIPGTSRSGSTILGAILIGTSRTIAAEFSFFLAIPTMFGASLLKIVKLGIFYSPAEWAILISGVITAFLVSILAIKFLLQFIKRNDFKPFGYYRIILGIVVFITLSILK